ncbi:hypothetical protein BDN72DRAFT_830514 [Pluteus cervinus]|uniref:Uncharacterized protein n=1 Tax=Pluteus cervinus TaxID=181527 RepID=A0ACD3BHH2_9AGAR|nr:hypothetical protein BDN72DRAFT_830514 [Pluteus cervinus]
MDSEIRQQLLALSDDFLEASIEDFTGFEQRFQELFDRISSALDQNLLSHETIALVNSVSQTITVLAEVFINLREKEDSIIADLQEDLNDLSNQAHATELHATSSSSRGQTRKPASTFIPAAYEWLLANLHNPYPSKTIQAAISRRAQCSSDSVNKWFVDIRKRSGWVNILKTRFFNKKRDIIDAATRFFIAKDPSQPLDNDCEKDFASFADHIRSLHDDDVEGVSATSVSFQDFEVSNQTARQASACYPSPLSSPGSAISFLDVDEPEYQASVNTSRMFIQHSTIHSAPRLCTSASAFPPSPAPSDSYPETSVTLVDEPVPVRKRKRRLSESDSNPHDQPRRVRQRPQAVSESFVKDIFNPNHLDDWFQRSDNASDLIIDQSLQDPFQVELFDFSTLNLPEFGAIDPTYNSQLFESLVSTPPTPPSNTFDNCAALPGPSTSSQKDLAELGELIPNPFVFQLSDFVSASEEPYSPDFILDNLVSFPSQNYATPDFSLWMDPFPSPL